MRAFIRANRAELDRHILAVMYRYDGHGGAGKVPEPPPKLNDEERQQWILNDEGLYRWAKGDGVR
jgi:hypothetical protein